MAHKSVTKLDSLSENSYGTGFVRVRATELSRELNLARAMVAAFLTQL